MGVNVHDFGASFEWTPPAGVEQVELFRSWVEGDDARQTLEAREGLTVSVREAGLFVIAF